MKWTGELPKKCNLCDCDLTSGFFDGKTIFGPWAIMCTECYDDAGTVPAQQYSADGTKIKDVK